MALSILTGTGWAALRQTIPGFAPVPERDVVLAGVRDLEPYQRARLEASEIRTVSGRVDRGELCAHLDGLRRGVDRAYLHVDLDVLDIGVGRANQYAAAGGPTLEAMILAIDAVFERLTIEAAAVTAYDPQLDPDRRVATASCRVIAAIARRALNQTCTRTPTDPSGPDPQLDVHP